MITLRYAGYSVDTREESFGTSGTRYTIYQVRADGKRLKRGGKEWTYRWDPSRAEETSTGLRAFGAEVENTFIRNEALLEWTDNGYVAISFGLEKIAQREGDELQVQTYSSSWGRTSASAPRIGYVKILAKRESRLEFWSDYYPTDKKGEKVVRV